MVKLRTAFAAFAVLACVCCIVSANELHLDVDDTVIQSTKSTEALKLIDPTPSDHRMLSPLINLG